MHRDSSKKPAGNGTERGGLVEVDRRPANLLASSEECSASIDKVVDVSDSTFDGIDGEHLHQQGGLLTEFQRLKPPVEGCGLGGFVEILFVEVLAYGTG